MNSFHSAPCGLNFICWSLPVNEELLILFRKLLHTIVVHLSKRPIDQKESWKPLDRSFWLVVFGANTSNKNRSHHMRGHENTGPEKSRLLFMWTIFFLVTWAFWTMCPRTRCQRRLKTPFAQRQMEHSFLHVLRSHLVTESDSNSMIQYLAHPTYKR